MYSYCPAMGVYVNVIYIYSSVSTVQAVMKNIKNKPEVAIVKYIVEEVWI
jgi:hypothetical protein